MTETRFIKVYRYSEGFLSRHVVTLSEASVLKEVYFMCCLHNNYDAKRT